jgi:hypothetical protein
MVDVESHSVDTDADPLALTIGGSTTPPAENINTLARTSPQQEQRSEVSFQEQLNLISTNLQMGLEMAGGELRPRQEPPQQAAVPTPVVPITSAPAPTPAKIPQTRSPSFSGSAKSPDRTPAPVVAVQMDRTAAAVPKASTPTTEVASLPVAPKIPTGTGRSIVNGEELTVEDVMRMWRNDVESRGLDPTLLLEESNRLTSGQIARLGSQNPDRPVLALPKGTRQSAAPPKTAIPQQTSVVQIPTEGQRPAGNIDGARKAKNLEIFVPVKHNSKLWTASFHAVCVTNKLDNQQAMALFRESLSERPLAYFEARFDYRTTKITDALIWVRRTYPSMDSRQHAFQLLRQCVWKKDMTAEQFIADFNHCFIHHPTCDEETKISLFLEKLPSSMKRLANLLKTQWYELNDLTLWVIQNFEPEENAAPVNSIAANEWHQWNDGYDSHAANEHSAAMTLPEMVNTLRSSGACFKCGQVGHIARTCRNTPQEEDTRGRGRGRGYRGYRGHRGAHYDQGQSRGTYLGKRKRDDP